MSPQRPRSERVVAWVAAHPWRVLLAAALLTGAALWSASGLDILTSRKALLPRDADVARRLERYLSAYGAESDLIVVLESGKAIQVGDQGKEKLSEKEIAESLK